MKIFLYLWLNDIFNVLFSLSVSTGDVGHLLPVLVMFDYKKEAKELQQALQDALKTLQAASTEIWSSNITQPLGAAQVCCEI